MPPTDRVSAAIGAKSKQLFGVKPTGSDGGCLNALNLLSAADGVFEREVCRGTGKTSSVRKDERPAGAPRRPYSLRYKSRYRGELCPTSRPPMLRFQSLNALAGAAIPAKTDRATRAERIVFTVILLDLSLLKWASITHTNDLVAFALPKSRF